MVRAPSTMGWSDRMFLSGNGLSLDGLLGRPGPTVRLMAWVGTRATPEAAGLQRMLWPGRPRTEPSAGHGYINVDGQWIVTTPISRAVTSAGSTWRASEPTSPAWRPQCGSPPLSLTVAVRLYDTHTLMASHDQYSGRQPTAACELP